MTFLLITALALVSAALAVSYITFRIAFYSPVKNRKSAEYYVGSEPKDDNERTIRGLTSELLERECESVEITSFDGLKLHGKYYYVSSTAPVEIAFHGYRSAAQRDFCGGSKISLNNGINLLLVEQRSHGQSAKKVITFGIKERYDCLCWANYAARRFGKETKIILSGVSMGAATVLMASNLALPENVCGIIADCPYSSPKEIIKKTCRDRGYPADVIYPFIKLGARIFGGFRLEESSPIKAVRDTEIPVLIIHGEADDFVPCSMGKRIYDACKSEKYLFTVPEASHAMSYIVDSDGYEKCVKTFFERILNK